MIETKYFRSFMLIQVFLNMTLCNPDLIKFNLIKSREILDGGEVVSIESFLDKGIAVDLTHKSKHPNVVYTSIQCTYADTVVHLLQTFFELFLYGVNSYAKINIPEIESYTKNWLISTINHFYNIKTPIVKMIENLFDQSDQIVLLRTTDKSFLKSLLSINLFLYYSINNNPFIIYSDIVTNNQNESAIFTINNDFNETIKNIRSLNSSIIQMIGLVERFRSKKCVVHDPFEYNYFVNHKLNDSIIKEIRNIKKLLDPTLHRINLLINGGSDNYDEFYSNIYDPEFLLYENLISHNNWFLGNIQVKFNGEESTLQSIYCDVKNTYNIDRILQFQYTLIKVIADVFYTQLYNLSMQPLNGITITELTILKLNFREYIHTILPSNCPINVCNKILKARAYLDKVYDSFDHSIHSNIYSKLNNRFKLENNIELININYQPDFTEDPSLSSLTNMMWSNAQSQSYRRVVKLLSYESYNNNDFNITHASMSNQIDTTSTQSYDTIFLNSIVELQYVLFSFYALLKIEEKAQIPNYIVKYSSGDLSDLLKIGFTTPENSTSKGKKGYRHITSDMLRVVVKLFKNLEGKPAVKNILLPLLIHFQHNEKYAYQKYMRKDDLYVTLQVSFLTISILENYLIRNFSFTFYNIFLYSTFIMNTKKGPDTSKLRHDLHIYAKSSKINFEDTLLSLNHLYNIETFKSFFLESDRQIEFVWDGRKQFGYDIFQNIILGVTDFNDLIRLQSFGVKWLTSKLLINIHNTMKCLRCEYSSEEIFKIIKKKLNEFMTIEFPKPIKIFLDDVFNATLITLNIDWTNLDDNIFDKLETIIHYGLKIMGAYTTASEPICAKIDNSIRAMDSETKELEKLSRSYLLETQNLVNSIDFSILPVRRKISDKIFAILIQID